VEDDRLVGAEAGAGGDAEQEGVADLAGSAGDGDTNGSLQRMPMSVSVKMTITRGIRR
jgi:hypothetical protein